VNKSRSILWVRLVVVVALLAIVGWWAWQKITPRVLPEGFASGNGRIEAVEVDVDDPDVSRPLPRDLADLLDSVAIRIDPCTERPTPPPIFTPSISAT
jgi:hypothetical protein